MRYVSKIPDRLCKSLPKVTYLCFDSYHYSLLDESCLGFVEAEVEWELRGTERNIRAMQNCELIQTHISHISSYKVSLSTCSYRQLCSRAQSQERFLRFVSHFLPIFFQIWILLHIQNWKPPSYLQNIVLKKPFLNTIHTDGVQEYHVTKGKENRKENRSWWSVLIYCLPPTQTVSFLIWEGLLNFSGTYSAIYLSATFTSQGEENCCILLSLIWKSSHPWVLPNNSKAWLWLRHYDFNMDWV